MSLWASSYTWGHLGELGEQKGRGHRGQLSPLLPLPLAQPVMLDKKHGYNVHVIIVHKPFKTYEV